MEEKVCPQMIDQRMIDDFMQLGDSVTLPTQALKQPTKMLKVEGYEFKLDFGKYDGKTVGQIIEEDPSYLIWLHDNHIRAIFVSNWLLDKALKNIAKKYKENTLDPQEEDLPF